MSWGPLIHGHAPKGLVKALGAAAARHELWRADSARDQARAAGRDADAVDGARALRRSGGTEAAMSAARVARAFARRGQDPQVRRLLSRPRRQLSRPGGIGCDDPRRPHQPGVAAAAARDTLVARYNDLDSVERVFEANRGEIAVFIEPIAGNMGVVRRGKASSTACGDHRT